MMMKLRLLLIRLRLRLERMLGRIGLGAPDTVHYIGGSDNLPPPLSKEDEAEALTALENGDDKARSLLIEHNLRLVVYIARRFENTGINLEDLISIGTIGLIKAIGSFKLSKNIKLATYASRCIENEILMHLRKVNSQRAEVSFDEPLNTDWDGNELLLEAVEKLSPREKQIIVLRYGLAGNRELTQKEVADLCGISQSYISRLEKRIISRLRRELARHF